MPTSPEKSIALLNLGHTLAFGKGRLDEAARYYKAAKNAPDNSWQRLYYSAWGPIGRWEWPAKTHDVADSGLGASGGRFETEKAFAFA